MESSILEIAGKQLSQEVASDSSLTEVSNNDVPVSETTKEIANVFSEKDVYRCVLPVELRPDPQVVAESQQAICEGTSSLKDSSPELTISSERTQEFKVPAISVRFAEQIPKRLVNNYGKKIEEAHTDVMLKGLDRWTIDKNPYSPAETKIINNLAQIISKANHLSLPDEEILVLTTSDFNSVVSVIKKLSRKVGLAELGAMVLLAIAVHDTYLLRKSGSKSESEFYKKNGDLMGISASCARDFAARGINFLRYRLDILNGIDEVTGMSLEAVANTCLAKLTYYDKAVEAFGEKQALIYFKTLTSREFQKKVHSKASCGRSIKKEKLPKKTDSGSDYDLRIKEFNLMPNEKRLLRIWAKRGIPICIDPLTQLLTDHQISLIETRYREHRLKEVQEYVKCRSERWGHYKAMDTDNPLKIDDLCFFNEVVYEKIVATREDYMEKGYETPDEPRQRFENRIFDYNDIVLRIRDGISQIQPARRTIAVLLYRLVNEKYFKGKWKTPREGVVYKSFGDFAIQELGLRENYRDYLAVGKALKEYHYFLDHLSDEDTEDTFLKLRHLPDALKNHKYDKYLVLARLRSLSVREFKRFSVDPDFDIHYERKLTEKEWYDFVEYCNVELRNKGFFSSMIKNPSKTDFIEAYHKSHESLIQWIAKKVIEETSLSLAPPAPMVDTTNASAEQVDETSKDTVNTIVDGSNQPLTA